MLVGFWGEVALLLVLSNMKMLAACGYVSTGTPSNKSTVADVGNAPFAEARFHDSGFTETYWWEDEGEEEWKRQEKPSGCQTGRYLRRNLFIF